MGGKLGRARALAALLGASLVLGGGGAAGDSSAAEEEWTAPGTPRLVQTGELPSRSQKAGTARPTIAFSGDGAHLYVPYFASNSENGFVVADAETGTPIWTVKAVDQSGAVKIAPDGRIFALPNRVAGAASQNLAIYDEALLGAPGNYAGPPRQLIQIDGARPTDVAFVSDDVQYVAAGTELVKLERDGAGVTAVTATITSSSGSSELAYDPATGWLWTLGANTGVGVYDTVSGEWLLQGLQLNPSGEKGGEALALDPARGAVVVLGGFPATAAYVFDAESRELIRSVPAGFGLSSARAAYSPGAGAFFLAHNGLAMVREVRLFDFPGFYDHFGWGSDFNETNLVGAHPDGTRVYLGDSRQIPVGAILGRTISPSVELQPGDASIALGEGESGRPVAFEIGAAGDPAPSVRWQSRPGFEGAWADLPGETGPRLELEASASDSGRQFRAILENSAGALASRAAKLTVSAPALTGPKEEAGEPRPPAAPAAVASGRPLIAAAGGRRPSRDGSLLLASVGCPGQIECRLSAPRRARLRVGGEAFRVAVAAPATVRPGGIGWVRARLPRPARAALVGSRGVLRLRLVASSAGQAVAKRLWVRPLGPTRGHN